MPEGIWVLLICGGLVAYAAVSEKLEGTVVTMPMLFTVLGLIVGKGAFGLMTSTPSSGDVELVVTAALVLVLFNDALRVRLGLLRREFGPPLRLLAIGLPLTIAAGVPAAMLISGGSLVAWILLSSLVAPTDAALGAAIVTDRRVPILVRQSLNVESGLNDGLVVPVVLVAAEVLVEEGVGAQYPLLTSLVKEIGFGVLGGVLAGGVAAYVLRQAVARKWAVVPWQQIALAATAAACYLLAALMGGSGFIAAYVGGLTFARVGGRVGENSQTADQIAEMLAAFTFAILGAVIIPYIWGRISWETVLFVLLALTVVRMVPVAVAFIGTGARRQTVLLAGWFGPRGLATIALATMLLEDRVPGADDLLVAAVLTVLVSVFAHGLTAAPLAGAYGRWYRRELKAGNVPFESGVATAFRNRGVTAAGTGAAVGGLGTSVAGTAGDGPGDDPAE